MVKVERDSNWMIGAWNIIGQKSLRGLILSYKIIDSVIESCVDS